MSPSVGGEKEITDYIKLFDYDVNLLATALKQIDGKVGRWTGRSSQFLAAPFVASLILTGIHAYLGVHVVERGVIFVDLSLAQIAALGATIALLLPFTGGDPHGPWVYWIEPRLHVHRRRDLLDDPRPARRGSRRRRSSASAYAVASAAAILAMSKATVGERAPQGHAGRQHPGRVVAGGRQDRARSTRVIGVFHYVFRRQFLAISMDHAKARARRASPCGSGTSSSTRRSASSSPRRCSIAGVLLVFCYLIVPSVAAMLYAERIGPRLAIGWTMGTVVSALGMYFSVKLDLPTGATIVCTFGLVLILMALARLLLGRREAAAA